MCSVAKVEPDTPEFAVEVSKGRQLERKDIVARESFAQQVRDDELAAGECLPTVTAAFSNFMEAPSSFTPTTPLRRFCYGEPPTPFLLSPSLSVRAASDVSVLMETSQFMSMTGKHRSWPTN